jgi:hypothetical protein
MRNYSTFRDLMFCEEDGGPVSVYGSLLLGALKLEVEFDGDSFHAWDRDGDLMDLIDYLQSAAEAGVRVTGIGGEDTLGVEAAIVVEAVDYPEAYRRVFATAAEAQLFFMGVE